MKPVYGVSKHGCVVTDGDIFGESDVLTSETSTSPSLSSSSPSSTLFRPLSLYTSSAGAAVSLAGSSNRSSLSSPAVTPNYGRRLSLENATRRYWQREVGDDGNASGWKEKEENSKDYQMDVKEKAGYGVGGDAIHAFCVLSSNVEQRETKATCTAAERLLSDRRILSAERNCTKNCGVYGNGYDCFRETLGNTCRESDAETANEVLKDKSAISKQHSTVDFQRGIQDGLSDKRRRSLDILLNPEISMELAGTKRCINATESPQTLFGELITENHRKRSGHLSLDIGMDKYMSGIYEGTESLTLDQPKDPHFQNRDPTVGTRQINHSGREKALAPTIGALASTVVDQHDYSSTEKPCGSSTPQNIPHAKERLEKPVNDPNGAVSYTSPPNKGSSYPGSKPALHILGSPVFVDAELHDTFGAHSCMSNNENYPGFLIPYRSNAGGKNHQDKNKSTAAHEVHSNQLINNAAALLETASSCPASVLDLTEDVKMTNKVCPSGEGHARKGHARFLDPTSKYGGHSITLNDAQCTVPTMEFLKQRKLIRQEQEKQDMEKINSATHAKSNFSDGCYSTESSGNYIAEAKRVLADAMSGLSKIEADTCKTRLVKHLTFFNCKSPDDVLVFLLSHLKKCVNSVHVFNLFPNVVILGHWVPCCNMSVHPLGMMIKHAQHCVRLVFLLQTYQTGR